jgi:GTP pyrophosphokinase
MGKKSFLAELEKHHLKFPEEKFPLLLADTMKKHNCNTVEDFYAAVGYGGIILQNISQSLREKIKNDFPEYENTSKNTTAAEASVEQLSEQLTVGLKLPAECIIVDGKNDIEVKFSKCCNPLPGDDIIGFITKGHGLSIHRKDCEHYLRVGADKALADRWIPAAWPENINKEILSSFRVTLDIISSPDDEIIYQIFQAFMANKITLNNTVNKTLPNSNKNFIMNINATGTKQLDGIIRELSKMPKIISVERKQD